MTRLPAHILADPALQAVLRAVETGGHRIYLVGGAVRNGLLGQPVDDIDLATDAPPPQVIELARQAGLKPVPTGIDHGTVTVVSDGRGFEVTTFRRDVETDGRRAVVAFSQDMAEDARRRDFTMNALYATRGGEVLDPVGGLADLRARRLRFVGRPEQRIREDYLRILRFFRFLAWYGRDADPDALAACRALCDGLARIARERIGAEMRKLLAAPDPAPSVALMAKGGVLAQVLPGADAAPLPALIAAEKATGTAPAWLRRLACLRAPDAAERLRLSRDEARRLAALADALRAGWPLDEAGYRLQAAGPDYALIRAAHGLPLPPDWRERLSIAAQARLPVAARDLEGLQGPALGRGLKAAERLWIDSGFTALPRTLIEAALQAGKDAT